MHTGVHKGAANVTVWRDLSRFPSRSLRCKGVYIVQNIIYLANKDTLAPPISGQWLMITSCGLGHARSPLGGGRFREGVSAIPVNFISLDARQSCYDSNLICLPLLSHFPLRVPY